MSQRRKFWIFTVFIIAILVISASYLSKVNVPVLEPKGPIADQEFRLMVLVTGLMLIVIVPVFILLAYIINKYKDTNQSLKRYSPDWDHNKYLEGLWWLIPTILISILSVITWNASYALSPFKPIPSVNKTINIQVISMDWKWLFIYPQQNVASVNQVVFPVNTPVHFYLTSDAPMNSFWIPQLSGQIYSMAGMQTQLNLMANTIGSFNGWSANISGIGFASMMFQAKSTSKTQFQTWLSKIRHNSPPLTQVAYNQLARPSEYVPVHYYSSPKYNLFNDTILKYMSPGASQSMGMIQ